MVMRRWLVIMSLVLAALWACSPAPYVPNRPDAHNLTSQSDLQGPVAMVAQEVYELNSARLYRQQVTSYDTAGRCLCLCVNAGESTRFEYAYDSAGRRISETYYLILDGRDSLVATTQYCYRMAGRLCLARIATPDGQRCTFRFRYNRKGQLRNFSYPDGSKFSYRYNDQGQAVECTYPDGSTEMLESPEADQTYLDARGRVAEEWYGTTCVRYTYDARNNWTRHMTLYKDQDTRLTVRTIQYHTI